VVEPPVATLPALREFRAPARWSRIDFISDLHLAADLPLTFAAWADYMLATPADAVFILGDLFDAWVGDDARHHGFEARSAAVLAQAARSRRVAFMVGNRDFLVGPAMLADCGVMALPDPTVLLAFGQRVLLTHGDALCLSDTEYQRYRAQVRDPQWQAGALALPLEERRQVAARIRHASEQRNVRGTMAPEVADIEGATALAWMRQAQAPVLVHGHTHEPGSGAMAPGYSRHVLSNWDLDGPGASQRGEVLRLTRDGFERLPPALAVRTAPAP